MYSFNWEIVRQWGYSHELDTAGKIDEKLQG